TVCVFLRPEFLWSYLIRGIVHGELREFAAAESDFDRAWRFGPDAAARYVLHVNRGAMRTRQGRYEEAVAELHAAIAVQPDQFLAHLNLAATYQKLQERDELSGSLWTLSPGPLPGLERLALAVTGLRRLDQAVAQLDE